MPSTATAAANPQPMQHRASVVIARDAAARPYDRMIFGTHEFVGLCRRIGAEPYICHNGLSDAQENLD